jgi:hypothetical protein
MAPQEIAPADSGELTSFGKTRNFLGTPLSCAPPDGETLFLQESRPWPNPPLPALPRPA